LWGFAVDLQVEKTTHHNGWPRIGLLGGTTIMQADDSELRGKLESLEMIISESSRPTLEAMLSTIERHLFSRKKSLSLDFILMITLEEPQRIIAKQDVVLLDLYYSDDQLERCNYSSFIDAAGKKYKP
jgi:hypothetical protein